MRTFALFILLFLFSVTVYSQSISGRRLKRINALNIKAEDLDLENYEVQKRLNKILELDKKQKVNRVVAIGAVSLSVGEMIAGGSMLFIGYKHRNNRVGETFLLLGSTLVVGSIFHGSLSIPFFVFSKKRKQERDKLIKTFDK